MRKSVKCKGKRCWIRQLCRSSRQFNVFRTFPCGFYDLLQLKGDFLLQVYNLGILVNSEVGGKNLNLRQEDVLWSEILQQVMKSKLRTLKKLRDSKPLCFIKTQISCVKIDKYAWNRAERKLMRTLVPGSIPGSDSLFSCINFKWDRLKTKKG